MQLYRLCFPSQGYLFRPEKFLSNEWVVGNIIGIIIPKTTQENRRHL